MNRFIMKPMVFASILLCHLVTLTAQAQINRTEPPFSLNLEQLKNWSPNSSLAEPKNISKVPLKSRIIAQLKPQQPPLDSQVKVLLAPDGMNNLANFFEPQAQFNLYNFTHWAHIDVFNWFTGEATVNVPARPWVDAAHQNGVKVIGTIFFRPAVYGGNAKTVADFLKTDQQGRFTYAHQLVDIANYYGFDGWLMNQETDLTVVKDANNDIIDGQFNPERGAELGLKMQHFMRYLTKIAPAGMEIHWYDAMLLDGSVAWQNRLNKKSAAFLEVASTEGSDRISDAIFLNYWWNALRVKSSVEAINELKRSPFDMYFGADLWPDRSAQKLFKRRGWLDALFSESGTKAHSSIALFASNASFIYPGSEQQPAFSQFKQDSSDYLSFYRSEVRLFGGDDLNLYLDDQGDNWPGLGRYVPAKSTITQLPFSTSFNTGHGKFKAQEGNVTLGEWFDLSQQDILPTWQFAINGNDRVKVFFDFEQAYSGGNSLAIRGDLTKGSVTIPLYQTALTVAADSTLELVFNQASSTAVLSVWLRTTDNHIINFPLSPQQGRWTKKTISLQQLAGQTISQIGFSLPAGTSRDFAVNIGQLSIQ